MILNKLKQETITDLAATINHSSLTAEEIKKFSGLLFDRLPLNLLAKLSAQDLEKMMAIIWESFRKPLLNQPMSAEL